VGFIIATNAAPREGSDKAELKRPSKHALSLCGLTLFAHASAKTTRT
jgi:hypothetical protein